PPADPVRAKGRFTHQRGQVLDVLKRIGESDAARRKALLKELTADAKSDAATRNLLETPQIAAIRDGLGG
ncbi:MAG: hypothetical protein O3A46_15370, partial [Candidatus Poribacteria bacterium]|nr:hypothetical protein [Candidatus Poribacteria bacterium]